jgi:archaellum biogenesis ATPase FlaH
MIRDIESAIAAFEEKFPNHEFDWKIAFNGRRATAKCPFHDDNNPSFNVFLGDNDRFFYKCFSCNEHGSVDIFAGDKELSEEDKKKIEEAKKKQADLVKFREKAHQNLISAIKDYSPAGLYFRKRTNLSEEQAINFLEHYLNVGLLNKNLEFDIPASCFTEYQANRLIKDNYLTFFYTTSADYITMIHLRKINTHDFETIKFSKLPSFFMRDYVYDSTKITFLVEGEFDAMAMDAAFFAEKNDVVGQFVFAAVSGTSGYTLDVINEARRLDTAVVLLPDSDFGGDNALINLYKNLKQKKINTNDIQIARIPEQFGYENERIKDVDEWFYGRNAKDLAYYMSSLKIQTLNEFINEIELAKYKENLKKIEIYPNNIKQILIKQQENKFNGSFIEKIENVSKAWNKYVNKDNDIVNAGGIALQQGAVNLIAADNGIGKTFITLQLCVNYILKKMKKVFFWAGEDDKATIIKRLNLIFSRMDSQEDIEIVKEKLDISTYLSEPFFSVDYGNVEETKEFQIFKQLLKNDDYGMIVLDPLSTFLLMIPETDNTKIRWGMTKFNNIVSETDKILVFTHHINKDSLRGDGALKELNKRLQNGENMDTHEVIDIANSLKTAIRGGMAITDLPRLVYFVLATQPDINGYAQRLLFRIKSNAGLQQEYIPIKLPFKSPQQQQAVQKQEQAKTATAVKNDKNSKIIQAHKKITEQEVYDDGYRF